MRLHHRHQLSVFASFFIKQQVAQTFHLSLYIWRPQIVKCQHLQSHSEQVHSMQNVKLAIWVGIRSLAHTQNLIVFLKYDTHVCMKVYVRVCVCVCEYICVCMHVCQIAYKDYIIMVTKFNNQSHTHNLYWWPPQSAIASYSTALYSLFYHTMIASCLQDLPFHSPVHNTSIACMQAVM